MGQFACRRSGLLSRPSSTRSFLNQVVAGSAIGSANERDTARWQRRGSDDHLVHTRSDSKVAPHDPALAPDGSLRYTGQGANKLGRLDPKTGEFKEYPLKPPGSGPRGFLAQVYVRQEEPGAAQQEFNQALRVQPGYLPAILGFGNINLQHDEANVALNYASQVIAAS
jgi:hypothetical protein